MLNREVKMKSQTEPSPEDQSFTCTNPSCGRFFSKPLKAVNLRAEKGEPYLACPYCLTEINDERSSSLDEVSSIQEEKTITNGEETAKSVEEKTSEAQAKGGCPYHFGYLSERSNKEHVPEECMVCGSMLDCMRRPRKS
jgi:hypothetical protein